MILLGIKTRSIITANKDKKMQQYFSTKALLGS
jgi:hypothetical protein